jgi:hypothetical protein
MAGFGQLTVNTFDEALHQGANTVTETFDFPDDISMYSEILMHFHLSCPPGGCDPWDRFATIKVEKNEVEYEIGRYVTPYANSWCDWTLDVSDYRELLQGNVTLMSYIETWSNGWEITIDFEFIEGTPEYQYTRTENLWVDYFFIYGDTIFYSIDLEELEREIPANAEKSIVRMVNTGHGQGNTQNAAEFSHMYHTLEVNGVGEFEHDHWKADCDVNPCSPQSGTWEFARAGWCPGEEVTPWDNEITDLVTPGESVELDYVLEPYFNLCSPWNPDCSNGQTCSECNYNGGTHTQPNYKIASQIIHYSNTAFPTSIETQESGFSWKVYPNPTKDFLTVEYPSNLDVLELQVVAINGEIILQQIISANQGSSVRLDLSSFAYGLYSVLLRTKDQILKKNIMLVQH